MLVRALAVVSVLVAGTVQQAGEGARDEGALPAVQWAGPRSGVAEAGFRRVDSREAWVSLWETHAGECADRAHQGWVMPPEIDFSRYMVICAFRGSAQRMKTPELVPSSAQNSSRSWKLS